mmetsp:Transcript_1834/g.5355  ORF Transcript_1834/g.5355 Transcript_1834/m.5355 type:complete len:200 (+) Transcript_1834:6-605(+)
MGGDSRIRSKLMTSNAHNVLRLSSSVLQIDSSNPNHPLKQNVAQRKGRTHSTPQQKKPKTGVDYVCQNMIECRFHYVQPAPSQNMSPDGHEAAVAAAVGQERTEGQSAPIESSIPTNWSNLAAPRGPLCGTAGCMRLGVVSSRHGGAVTCCLPRSSLRSSGLGGAFTPPSAAGLCRVACLLVTYFPLWLAWHALGGHGG